MNTYRRRALKAGGNATLLAVLGAAGWVGPNNVFAQGWNKSAFDTKTVEETVKAFGGSAPVMSKDIAIIAPDIAENGAVVPISITSSIPRTETISILIEKNPNILAAAFDIPTGTEATVTTRVKMGQSSNVYALIKADSKYYVAVKDVKVTLGGCGG